MKTLTHTGFVLTNDWYTKDKLQTMATFIHEQLAELTIADIRKEISSMSNGKGWKSYIECEYGVVTNLVGLLNGLYADITNINKSVHVVLGQYGSRKWKLFQIRVIKMLLNPLEFDPEYTYDDTADDCDEVVLDTAYYLALAELKVLHNPETL